MRLMHARRFCFAGVLAVVVGAFPADAQATIAVPCTEDSLCLYDAADGAIGTVVTIDNRNRISNKVANVMNNAASSYHNHTGYAAWLYDKRDGRGARLCVDPTGIHTILPTEFNDLISSTKVTRKLACPM